MTKIANILAVIALVGVLVLGVHVYGGGQKLGGVHYEEEFFNGPVSFASTISRLASGVKTTLLNSSGVFIGSLAPGNGTTISSYSCTSASWNPAAVTTTTLATATTSASSAALGDVVDSSLATTTQGLDLYSYVSAAGVISSQLSQPDIDAASLDLATTTLKVCYTH